ncbi:Deoxyribonuclease NucA [Bacillus subtilis subsp. subtilis str. BSP1]|nr:Deoxyribonuclease NucA [Bacillus subtilis subsp. subtilis str. BSP1]
MSAGEMYSTEAPSPPSLHMAIGHSSLSYPFLEGTSFNDCSRRSSAPSLSIVHTSECPSFIASLICLAVSGYRSDGKAIVSSYSFV